MAKQITEFQLKVTGAQDAIKQLESLGKAAEQDTQAINELQASLEKTATELLDSAKNADQLKKAIKEVTNIRSSGVLDDKQTARIAAALGQARDQVIDLREEAIALGGTRLEIFRNAISNLGIGVVNADIDKLKLGFNGLKTAITGGATGFKALGNAMKVAGIGLLVSAIGLLFTNMDAVYKVLVKWIPGFETLANFIKGIVQSVTDFAGITSAAEREAEAAKKRMEGLQDINKRIENNRIAIMKDGIEKDKAIAKQKYEDLQANYKKEKELLIKSGLSENEATDKTREAAKLDNEVYLKEIADIEEKYRKINQEANKKYWDDLSKMKNLDQEYTLEAAEAAEQDARAQEKLKKAIEERDAARLGSEIYKKMINPEGLQEEMALQIENELLWYDERLENLKNFYEQGIITQEEYNKRSKDLNIAKMEYEEAVANQYIGILSMIGQGFALFGEENKGLAIAGVLIEKAAGIFQVISSTSVASARALAELGPVIGAPYAAAIKVNGAFQVGLLAAQSIKAISDINSVGGNQGSGGERAIYAKGGLLTGPSHAQGGIMTPFGELEGGEFVMNRRSTMSFLPILEELNRIGNGEPTVSTSSSKSTPIIKTYVLASDVTSQQEAQVKIKRAARL
jgi:hypothetical protein